MSDDNSVFDDINEDDEMTDAEDSSSELDGFEPDPGVDGDDAMEADADSDTEMVSEDIPREDLEASELAAFEAAEIEEKEFVEDERIESIIESYLFATDRPVSLASIKALFAGTQVGVDKVRKALDRLAVEYAGAKRGVVLEEISGGYQLRTKMDNLDFLKRSLKARTFKLSGPALEVLAIVAYKQPTIKAEIDQIRGVESGHLLRALMEKGLINFEGKSDLPGKPMQYATSRKFLEIFGLRNLRELPTLSQIDELLPEGIGDDDSDLVKLADITGGLSENFTGNYSIGEDELGKIESQLSEIKTSTEFFDEEKRKKAEARKASFAPKSDSALTDEAAGTTDENVTAANDNFISDEANSIDEADSLFSSDEGTSEEPNGGNDPEPEASV